MCYNKFGAGHCCNDGQAEFYHGDIRTRVGIHELKRGLRDVECGLLEMEKGFIDTARKNKFDFNCCKPCGGFSTCGFSGFNNCNYGGCGSCGFNTCGFNTCGFNTCGFNTCGFGGLNKFGGDLFW